MARQVGDRDQIPCVILDCPGWMVGVLGGQFVQAGARWQQYLNCHCGVCGCFKPEVFEVVSGDAYWVTDCIEIVDERGVIVSWQGFGMPVAEIPDPVALMQRAVRLVMTDDQWRLRERDEL